MLTILLGVTTFAVVVVGLTAVLMVAKAKLVNSGDVRIIINDDEDNALVVPAGSNLLNTLANQKIFLPSAHTRGPPPHFIIHHPPSTASANQNPILLKLKTT